MEVTEEVAKAIKKEKRFSYPGFGTFNVKSRKARKGRNPQTGEVININLTWECLARAEESYTIFVHLIDPGNVRESQRAIGPERILSDEAETTQHR